MESLLYSETFFLISSICLVFITLLLIIVLIYIVNIMRVMYDITKIVKKKTRELSETLDEVGEQLTDSKLMTFFSLFLSPKKKKAKKTIVK